MSKDDLFMVFCTFPDLAQARHIGTVLVERQLVACVNLLPQAESIYAWEGEVKRESEVLAILKTSESGYEELERTLLSLHPYEVPEIVAIHAADSLEAYRKWVGGAVRSL